MADQRCPHCDYLYATEYAYGLHMKDAHGLECNGLCMTAADVGVMTDAIAYGHPECPLHGDIERLEGVAEAMQHHNEQIDPRGL